MSIPGNRSSAHRLSPADVQSLRDSPDVLLVDVRTPGEFESTHIDGSVNLPLHHIEAHAERIVSTTQGRRMVIICQSGGRASQAYERLTRAGLADAALLDGGLQAWLNSGAPVNHAERPRWALERQVRLVAGSLILLFIVASIWMPALRYLAGAVGAGLVIAAVTNTCTMGMLLAKLPYNRGPKTNADTIIDRASQSRAR